MTTDFPHPAANVENEDKGRLSDELAVQIMRQLDAGMKIEVQDWGHYAIQPLGVSRIIDRYYDTLGRMFHISMSHRRWTRGTEFILNWKS